MSAEGIRARYAAFVSYSHSADRELARNLQRALERMGTPWYRARALHVFRDETDLTANPELWQYLTRALDAADFFVLLASPEAAASPWVNKELEYWLGKHPASTILIAITAGELEWDSASADFDWRRTDCIPAALATRFKDVPTAADLRSIEARKLGDPDFTQQVAKLVAAIRDVPVRELYDLEMTRYRRRLRWIGATAATLAALLVIVGWQLVRIQTQSRDAIAEALASRARVEQASAPARAARLAATAVALRDSPRTRGQWIAAAHGLADWTATLPDARLTDFADGQLVVTDASGEVRTLPLPFIPASTTVAAQAETGLRVIDKGKCIAEDYVTPAPQGGDVRVCNASELAFGAANVGSAGQLWLTVAGDVSAVPAAPSCATMLLLQRNPIRGEVSVGDIDSAFLRRNAHASARTEDANSLGVDPPAGWLPLGTIDRPAATAACALLFLDPTRQLRRWRRGDGQSLVSDSSLGPIEDYRVSPDGRWLAIQHAGGRFVVLHADPPSARPALDIRWAAPSRAADGSYVGVVLGADKSTSTLCLRSAGSSACDAQLRLAPGVLGGEGEAFIDVSRTRCRPSRCVELSGVRGLQTCIGCHRVRGCVWRRARRGARRCDFPRCEACSRRPRQHCEDVRSPRRPPRQPDAHAHVRSDATRI
jgi:hypothetical protein